MFASCVIGMVLALAVGCFATMTRLDRDRAFYPTVLIVVASYYVLFAAIGGTSRTVIVESAIAAVFLVAASWGFRRSSWIVVAALAAHGVFDMLHGFVIANPGVPAWWPAFCCAYDVAAAAFLAWMLRRGPRRGGPQTAAVVP